MFNLFRKQQQQPQEIRQEIRSEIKWHLLAERTERLLKEQEALLNKMTLREREAI